MGNNLKSITFNIRPEKYETLNKTLMKVKIYVAATGKNANYTDITKEAMLKSMDSIYNCPIVCHFIKKEDGRVIIGSHDEEIVISDNGFEVNNLCVICGLVPESCNPRFEIITGKSDNLTKNEYLVVDAYLWVQRYPELIDAIYSEDFLYNQSMEIMVESCEDCTDNPRYLQINEYVYSALCLLNKSDNKIENKNPCFPSASVVSLGYSLNEDQFKKDFSLLVQETKKFILESSKEDADLYIKTQSKESVDNNLNKEANNLENKDKNFNQDVSFLDISSKINQLMSEVKYRSSSDKHYNKYEVFFIDENANTINIADREDGYKIYKVPYMATNTNEGLVVNIDYENKIEKSLIIGDKSENTFNIKKEIEMISKDFSEHSVSVYSSIKINDLTGKLDDITHKFESAKNEVDRLTKQLGIFEKEKEQFATQKHKEVIDTLISSKRDEMGKYSEYLQYCIDPDYNKQIEQVEKELKDIHYNFLNSKNGKNKNNKFSSIETNPIEGSADKEYEALVKQYGADIAKYFRK